MYKVYASLVLTLFLFSPQVASAADVQGTVTDDAAVPLAGATVQLFDENSGVQRYGTATAADGTFRFENIRAGRYQLVVSYVGFAEYRERLVVAPNVDLDLTIQLSARAVQQQEVVVTALRAREQLNPITFSNLTARELELQPAMKDLPVHLATLPSITTYSENGNGMGYTYLRMRGFDQRRVAVAINGIPQNDPEEHNVFWINFFDIEGAIQDIQVQRGAGSAFYGPTAIGGAINVVAVPYKPYPYAMVEAGYGSFDTQRYTVEANTGLLDDRYVVFGRFSRLLSDGYRDWSWTEFYRFFGGVARYGENSTVMLQAYGGPQRDGLAYIGIPKEANEDEDARRDNLSAFTEDIEDFHQPHLELLHDWQIRPGLDFHQALFGIKGEGYFDFDGSFRSPDYLMLPENFGDLSDEDRQQPLYVVAPEASLLFRAYLDQWQVGWQPHLTLTRGTSETTIGAEARLHRSLRWGRIQEATRPIPDDRIGDNDVRVYSVRGEKIITSLYGSHLFRPVERLAVQADVQLTYRRYRIFDEAFFGAEFEKPYFFVNPRLGVTFNPEQPLSAYASVAYTNREPRMKSLYDGEEAGAGFQPQFEQNANGSFDYDVPFVEAEQLIDIELGSALVKQRYRLSANVFYMDFRDEIVPSGGLDQF
ncbi:MAG TPA: TonB-dependent receptor, partial [Rhodothermales bacterium]|nr:TonB-dependent receptor [Rhodothermales bacterium]